MLALDEHLKLEMQYFFCNAGFTADEDLVYRRRRLTYWLFHQMLKGTTSCLTWAGESTGDVLGVTFVALL